MAFLNWLLRHAPDIETPVPPTPVVLGKPDVPAPPPNVPDPDECENLEQVDERGEITLEPVYCVIDYCDSSGHQTRRRITLLKASRGPHAPMLMAICHERKAMRTFRCDRIECFITDEGEVIETQEFFKDCLFIDLADLCPDPVEAKVLGQAQAIREMLRPALSVLVTAAKCDDEFHPAELDVICCYIEDELNSPKFQKLIKGVPLLDILDQLTTIVEKMRPSREALPGYLIKISEMSSHRLDRLTNALRDLILADGRIVAEETLLISELAELRASIDGANWPDLGLPEIEWE